MFKTPFRKNLAFAISILSLLIFSIIQFVALRHHNIYAALISIEFAIFNCILIEYKFIDRKMETMDEMLERVKKNEVRITDFALFLIAPTMINLYMICQRLISEWNNVDVKNIFLTIVAFTLLIFLSLQYYGISKRVIKK